MDVLIGIFIGFGIAVFVAYRHGYLAGVTKTLQAKAPQAEMDAAAWVQRLLAKRPVSPATPPPTVAPTVASPISMTDALASLQLAQQQLSALQAQGVR